MNLDWLLNSLAYSARIASTIPISSYLLVGLGVVAYLMLWVSNVRALKSARTGVVLSHESIRAVQNLSDSIEQMRQALDDQKLAAAQMNPALRAEALVLHHRGEPLERIAKTLGKPKNEVELLVKLNRLLECKN